MCSVLCTVKALVSLQQAAYRAFSGQLGLQRAILKCLQASDQKQNKTIQVYYMGSNWENL